MNLLITRAEVHDNPTPIAALINRAYAHKPYVRPGYPRITVQEVRHIIMNTRNPLYLCWEGTHLCGVAVLDTTTQHKPQLGPFAVDSAYKGRKIGSLLIKHIEQELEKNNKSELYVKVVPLLQEALINYYKKQGFAATGTTESLPKKTLEKSIKQEYWKSIYLQEMCKKIPSKRKKIAQANNIESYYPSYVDYNSYGLCLRASKNLLKGTVVATANFEKTDKEYIADHQSEEHTYVALMDVSEQGDPVWGKVRGKWAYCNHSCDPNCDITDEWNIVTNRDIGYGQELTTSYDALVYNFPWPTTWNFACKCNSSGCKNIINAYRSDIIYPIKPKIKT